MSTSTGTHPSASLLLPSSGHRPNRHPLRPPQVGGLRFDIPFQILILYAGHLRVTWRSPPNCCQVGVKTAMYESCRSPMCFLRPRPCRDTDSTRLGASQTPGAFSGSVCSGSVRGFGGDVTGAAGGEARPLSVALRPQSEGCDKLASFSFELIITFADSYLCHAIIIRKERKGPSARDKIGGYSSLPHFPPFIALTHFFFLLSLQQHSNHRHSIFAGPQSHHSV